MKLEKNPKTRPIAKLILKAEDRAKGVPFPKLRRVKQVTVFHCAPAVLEAFFSFFGVKINQEAVVKVLRAEKKIEKYGLSTKEMAKAVRVLGKRKYAFWQKTHSKINDIQEIITKFNYPVGIEWQGVFYEDDDGDSGHYCIVTRVDKEKKTLRIMDPYPKFVGVDRKFTFAFFEKRWWDTNEIKVPGRKKLKMVRDDRLIFLVTPKDVDFPKELGMIRL